MTLDEVINQYYDLVQIEEQTIYAYKKWNMWEDKIKKHKERLEGYNQILKWLTELKETKEHIENFKSEILETYEEEKKEDSKWARGLKYSLTILDNYLPKEGYKDEH